MSEKIIKHHKKEEFVVNKLTQFEMLKEECNKKIKERIQTVEEKVKLYSQKIYINYFQLYKINFIYYFKYIEEFNYP